MQFLAAVSAILLAAPFASTTPFPSLTVVTTLPPATVPSLLDGADIKSANPSGLEKRAGTVSFATHSAANCGSTVIQNFGLAGNLNQCHSTGTVGSISFAADPNCKALFYADNTCSGTNGGVISSSGVSGCQAGTVTINNKKFSLTSFSVQCV